MNLFKKILIFMTIVLTISLLGFTTHTLASPTQKVYDLDNSLTTSEYKALNDEAIRLTNKHAFDIVVVITDNIQNKSARAFSDDFFDYKGFGIGSKRSGILLLVNNDTFVDYISTSGSGIKLFSDKKINTMLESAGKQFKKENFYVGISTFLSNVDYNIENGTLLTASQRRERAFTAIATSLVVGLIAAAAMVLVVFNRYRFHSVPNANVYLSCDGLDYVVKDDNYIRTYVTKTYSPRQSSSSGGSSTHRSSSGRTHGGGGRRR